MKQNRSTEGCSKLKRSVDMTSSGKNGLNIRTLEQMQVPNGTGRGVRRSKRPLLASRTRKFEVHITFPILTFNH